MDKNVIIATALNDHARIYLIDSKQIVEKARILHDLYPTSCAALGRTLSVAALMGLMQKEKEEYVTVNINGGGPIGTVMCVAGSDGKVKGFCGDKHIYKTYEGTNKLAVGPSVGTDGFLKVIKDLKMDRSYSSETPLISGEIGDDFSYFFLKSEQVPSVVSVGVLVDTDYSVRSAGAMIIQLLPGHEEKDISYLESLELKPISSVLDENGDLEAYLHSLFADAEILERKEAAYECDCSRERFMAGLLTLPEKDIRELSADEKIEIKCEFCDRKYEFSREDLETILRYAGNKK